jgi:hypothetical protein
VTCSVEADQARRAAHLAAALCTSDLSAACDAVRADARSVGHAWLGHGVRCNVGNVGNVGNVRR